MLTLATVVFASGSMADEVPIKTLQRNISDLRAQVTELRVQNQRMQDILEHMAAAQLVQSAGAPTREDAAKRSQELRASVNGAYDAFARIPRNALPEELRTKIESCLKDVKGLPPPSPDAAPVPGFELKNCDAKTRGEIQRGLAALEQQARDDWKNCRDELLNHTPTSASSLPSEPTDSVTLQKTLEALSNGPDPTGCASKLKDAVETLRAKKTTEEALASALTLASQVCFASGGNPYVCGGMLVVAVLMELFSHHGDGDGGSSHESETGVPGVPGPHPSTPDPLSGSDVKSPGNVVTESKDGIGFCNVDSLRIAMTCALKNNIDATSSKFSTSAMNPMKGRAADAFKSFLAAPGRKEMLLCLDEGKKLIRGMVYRDDESNYWSVALGVPGGAITLMRLPGKTLDCAAFD